MNPEVLLMPSTLNTHAENAIAELRAAWQQPGAGYNSYGGPRHQPIAGGPQDQPALAGVENPLWEIIRWLPASKPWYDGGLLEPDSYPADLGDLRRWEPFGVARRDLVTRYAWSIISPGDVAWIVEQLGGRAVVEVGAGSGYWAWQLEQAGIDVAAYDPHPPAEGNAYCKHGTWTTVLPGGAQVAAEYPDRALLMVWPPYEGEHAEEALRAYRGDLLIFAGEGQYGCTADDGFYELLDAEWVEVSVAPQHVTFWGIHCQLAAYRRKNGEAS
jgi:hypothetical protein